MVRFTARLLVVGLFFLNSSLRSAEAFNVGIEPTIGYRIQKRDNPDRTSKTLTYGGRLVLGIPLLSAEVGYSGGNSTEEFPSQFLTIRETTEQYRVGLRSDISTGILSFIRVRAGAEARKVTSERTLNLVTTRNVSPTKVYPYVGAGLGLGVTSSLKVVAEVTVTVIDMNDFSKNEITPSLGIAIGF